MVSISRAATLAVVAALSFASTATASSGSPPPLSTSNDASSRSATDTSPPTRRAERRRAARTLRSMGRMMRRSARRPRANGPARIAVYDSRARVTCRGDYAPRLDLTIDAHATFGARPGEALYYRLWGWDAGRGSYLSPSGWNVITAGNPLSGWGTTLWVSGSRTVAPLLETWSASRGYQSDWYPPLPGLGASASGWYCLF